MSLELVSSNILPFKDTFSLFKNSKKYRKFQEAEQELLMNLDRVSAPSKLDPILSLGYSLINSELPWSLSNSTAITFTFISHVGVNYLGIIINDLSNPGKKSHVLYNLPSGELEKTLHFL